MKKKIHGKFYLISLLKDDQEISKPSDGKEEARRRIFLAQDLPWQDNEIGKALIHLKNNKCHVGKRAGNKIENVNKTEKVIFYPVTEGLGCEIHPIVSFIVVNK